MLRFLRREKEKIDEPNLVYHARLKTQDPNINLTLCNQKSSHNWIKYNEENFLRKKIFNILRGTDIQIDGKRCRKCLRILDKK